MADAPPIHPNTMTALRLPLAPLAIGFLLMGNVWGTVLAALLSLVLEFTDLADGWIARRYNVVSDFGSLFDPFADAFCRFTLFLGIYAIGKADLWMILLIFYRDSSIAFIRSIAATRNTIISARPSGKLKAIIQGVGTQVCYIAIVLAKLFPAQAAFFDPIPWWTMLFITLATAASLVDYMLGTREIIRSAWLDEHGR